MICSMLLHTHTHTLMDMKLLNTTKLNLIDHAAGPISQLWSMILITPETVHWKNMSLSKSDE